MLLLTQRALKCAPRVTLFEPLFLKRSEPLVTDFIITCNFNVHSEFDFSLSAGQVSLMNKTRSRYETSTL